jgi:hypothetical protein
MATGAPPADVLLKPIVSCEVLAAKTLDPLAGVTPVASSVQ